MCDRESESTGEGESRRKRVLGSQAREMVFNLRLYFEEEKKNNAPLLPLEKVIDRTAAALKISRATIVRISREKYGGEEEPTAQLRTPGKKRPRESKTLSMDSFQESEIRQHIQHYYLRKEYPTIRKLLVTLKEAGLFSGGRTSLRLALNKIGFQFQTFSGRKILLERQEIASWRGRFLRSIGKTEIKEIVWLGETCVNAGHCHKKSCTDSTNKGEMKTPVGKGGRMILLHAGTSKGFVKNALLLFRSRKTVDYHEEITPESFTQWFQEQLLPNIEKNSVIVMDNASYHSVQINRAPTQASRKEMILKWLREKNVAVEEEMTKAELLECVSMHEDTSKRYYIDELAEINGHKVLRLPPSHCHFNAIEKAWAQVKGYVAKNNKTFNLGDVEKLIHDGIEEVTPQRWADIVRHTGNELGDALNNEGILEECMEQMITSATSSISSESGAESQEEDDDERFTTGRRHKRLDEEGPSTSTAVEDDDLGVSNIGDYVDVVIN